MTVKKDAKEIFTRITRAINAASINNAPEIREAIKMIRDFGFEGEDKPVADAFIELLERSADRKERILRETFGNC